MSSIVAYAGKDVVFVSFELATYPEAVKRRQQTGGGIVVEPRSDFRRSSGSVRERCFCAPFYDRVLLTWISNCAQPLLRRPDAMPLIVSSIVRFTTSSVSPARKRFRSAICRWFRGSM